MSPSGYEGAGVRGQGDALKSVERHLRPTFSFPDSAEVLTGFGHYASVVKLNDSLAIALCTDGVGSKTIVASALDRYDTIASDCVAMNVNDLICVGATPVALVDYLGVNTLDPARVDDILSGLGAAAKEAGVAVPGGELAQLPEVIGSDGRSVGDERAFDLVGTCVGTVQPDKLILGQAIKPGDTVIGVASSGLHSNGFTLARRVLLADAGLDLEETIPELGCTLGDELLRPTEIYVRAARALWSAGIDVRGLAHITGDGLANLCRLDAPVGYLLDDLPDPPAVFGLIQRAGRVSDAEMHRVFNMGIGLAVVVPAAQESRARGLIDGAGYAARRIGRVTEKTGRVEIPQRGLAGSLDDGDSVFSEM